MAAPPQPPVPVSALSERSLRAHQQQLRQAEGRAGVQPSPAGSKRDPAQTDGRVSTSAPIYTLALDPAAAAASPSHLAAALRTATSAAKLGPKATRGAQVGAKHAPACVCLQMRPFLHAGSGCCLGGWLSHLAPALRTATLDTKGPQAAGRADVAVGCAPYVATFVVRGPVDSGPGRCSSRHLPTSP